MLFDRFRLRFWLHFGTQNAPKNESKKQLNFQPILSGFWSILGASRAPLGDHFGLQKSMKKHPSSKDPSRDAQWTPKGSKIKQNGPLRLPKWTKNGAKMKRNGSHPGWQWPKKRTQFECKSEFQLGLQESSNEVWSYRLSKNMAVQVSLWGPAVTPALRAQ